MVIRKRDSNERRIAIASAGIAIVARDGVRALTHRAVDGEAKLPPGSTSYYAGTREALIALIVGELATRSMSDIDEFTTGLSQSLASGATTTGQHLASHLSRLIEAFATRTNDMRTRYALIIELGAHSDLGRSLLGESTVHRAAGELVSDALKRVAIPHSDRDVSDLLGFVDSLVFQKVVLSAHIDHERMLANQLRALTP